MLVLSCLTITRASLSRRGTGGVETDATGELAGDLAKEVRPQAPGQHGPGREWTKDKRQASWRAFSSERAIRQEQREARRGGGNGKCHKRIGERFGGEEVRPQTLSGQNGPQTDKRVDKRVGAQKERGVPLEERTAAGGVGRGWHWINIANELASDSARSKCGGGGKGVATQGEKKKENRKVLLLRQKTRGAAERGWQRKM